ncbi:class I SAM-dependent methyltransferase [Gilvimarinus sp. DA14]|uniref:class I SAM-dependent methyltransferase n=1 Tax=Gilvimarinus sp. DA14 TaxID=2956798 RepID=UPI0020B6CB32|nr:class I SAM-dependent methyltransferase [Gilvimarinus sp. DA14]UTF61373.1 class I SAM-dependent methyltransferase [Gilvimarinus sp. DA14]
MILDSAPVARLLAEWEAQQAPDSRRLFHGRGQCYPGYEHWVVDYYQPVILLTLFATPAATELEQVMAELSPLLGKAATAVLLQRRYLSGAPAEVIYGEMPANWFARRGDLRFQLALEGQQNPGFFLDMEPGRQWLEQRAEGKRILNLFAYTCAFSVVAVAAGADCVVNVDMSKAALARGRDNHHLNGLDKKRSQFLPEQILKSWSRVRRPGPYDIVIFDPPSFQKGSFVASRDYAKLVRRLPELMPAGGDVLACLNAPELGPEFIAEVFAAECPEASFVARLPGSPDFPDADPARQLKLLHYAYPGLNDSAESA